MVLKENKQLLWGALLIALGGFFLLQVTGILGALSDLFWSLAFGAAGAVFLYVFLTALHERWWAAIPGFTLLGLAATVFYSRFAPPILDGMTGAIFLGSISAGFWAVFVTNPRHWWAIIPGGALLSVAAVAAVDALPIPLINSGSVLFIGLGLTFGLLGLLSTYLGRNLRWAYIPAAILLVMGLVVVTPFVGALAWLWPLALIGAGAYLILRRSPTASKSPAQPVAADTALVATDTAPVATDTAPVATDTAPVATDTAPVATDTAPDPGQRNDAPTAVASSPAVREPAMPLR